MSRSASTPTRPAPDPTQDAARAGQHALRTRKDHRALTCGKRPTTPETIEPLGAQIGEARREPAEHGVSGASGRADEVQGRPVRPTRGTFLSSVKRGANAAEQRSC